jgi:hypothetical protein
MLQREQMFWGTDLSALFSFQVSHGFYPSLTKRQYYFKQRSHNFLGHTIAQSLGRFTGVAIWSWHTPVPSGLNRSTWTHGGLTKIKRKVRKNAVKRGQSPVTAPTTPTPGNRVPKSPMWQAQSQPEPDKNHAARQSNPRTSPSTASRSFTNTR